MPSCLNCDVTPVSFCHTSWDAFVDYQRLKPFEGSIRDNGKFVGYRDESPSLEAIKSLIARKIGFGVEPLISNFQYVDN